MQTELSDYINNLDSNKESYLDFDESVIPSNGGFFNPSDLKAKLSSLMRDGKIYRASDIDKPMWVNLLKLMMHETSIDKQKLIKKVSDAIAIVYEDSMCRSFGDIAELIFKSLDQPEFFGDNVKFYVNSKHLGETICDHLISEYYFDIDEMIEKILDSDKDLKKVYLEAYPLFGETSNDPQDYSEIRGV